MGYLLDTDICIYIIKKKPESVLKRLRELPLGEIGISSLTVAELVTNNEREFRRISMLDVENRVE